MEDETSALHQSCGLSCVTYKKKKKIGGKKEMEHELA